MAVTMGSVMHTDVLSGRDSTSMHFNQAYSADPPASPQREAEKPAAPATCCTEQPPRQRELERVLMPDLFVSFISQRPKPNPYYEVIKEESETWMKQICNWTEKEHMKHIIADFPYFIAVFTTEAGPDEFRTLVDWNKWVFDFDDIFDEGELHKHPENARKEVEACIELMKSPNPIIYSAEQYPLRHVFQSVWQRYAKRSSLGAQRRYIKSMETYFSGLVGQVEVRSSASKADIETYMTLRRQSIATFPCFALVEYFHALDIPDEVFEHESIREIEIIATEMVLLQNDILSYPKEHSMGVVHNIVHLFRQDGLSHQEAYDRVNELLKKCYNRWYIALSDLPVWGEAVDVQVQMYIKGCQDIILANVNWSFKSERYFGKDNAVVRKTRMVPMI